MAQWNDLVAYIRQTYRVIRDDPGEIRIRVLFGDDAETTGRAQVVVIAREIFDQREDWVQIATPFARVDEVDLLTVLTEVGQTLVVGGLVVMGEHLVLRHSLPLLNLDLNEFTDPLELVAGSAELLEQQFTGRDDY
ncbi:MULTISPECIES: hypothetical protein [Actinomycetes]|uniref:YbjN domain-containing protein n=2 Tax=Amycolatopsis TaxID=1813 RepID=A0A2N3WM81_9PSEU|nr:MULTISPECIES: hypothetical protein [Actinomycetes]ATY14267.1 hypothetical protein CU254_30505 [Amycolatopsis sp. AA4]EFL10335.1 predicted protein [Streptomyces sp. AA4]MBB1154096.1 hypothetical protein [Amycolatopsis dendrobii]MBB2498918.1 hypothetical protein [Amycolatopsis echigonensis]PKV94984.1 hypothetical protein ATK30_5877 [Amycolatopsis niigatensis]